VLLDEVEEDVDPFGRREVRVVLLVSAVGVSEAREHLDDAFHLRTIAHSRGKAQARFCRCKRRGARGLGSAESLIVPGKFPKFTERKKRTGNGRRVSRHSLEKRGLQLSAVFA
jgi:hypothetical protein